MSHSPDFDLLLDQWVQAARARLVAHIVVRVDVLRAQLRADYAAAQARLQATMPHASEADTSVLH